MRYFSKVVFQTINMLWVMLRRTQKPSHVIMQVMCLYADLLIVAVTLTFACTL